MSKTVRALLTELERHGVQVLAGGRLHVTGEAPVALLMRAHSNRRALEAAVKAQPG
ncbi:hypothetical protein [Azospirillum sp. ST 5-10]|uniref:hypothetical protein n=1 Tax=unclassified Azospirillum TaxID=2630922 RepID=UPI003F49C3B4